jgi:hypothetical protein
MSSSNAQPDDVGCTVVSRDSEVPLLEGFTVAVGREPGTGGVAVGCDDPAVSSRALLASVQAGLVRLENASTYASLEVTTTRGLRYLFPGEAIEVDVDATVTIPGRIESHPVRIVVQHPSDTPAPRTGTQPLLPTEIGIPQERKSVLVAMCLARFFPDRYGSALLSASDIVGVLRRHGEPVTAKAVNNKIQRTREQLAERHGVYLESRDDLADFLIRHGLVSVEDAQSMT